MNSRVGSEQYTGKQSNWCVMQNVCKHKGTLWVENDRGSIVCEFAKYLANICTVLDIG